MDLAYISALKTNVKKHDQVRWMQSEPHGVCNTMGLEMSFISAFVTDLNHG